MKKSPSITSKFRTAFLILALVPVTIFGIISYYQLQIAVTSQMKDLLLVSSMNKKIAIDHWLDNLQEESNLFAHLEIVRSQTPLLCSTVNSAAEQETARQLIDEALKPKLFDQSNFTGVYIATMSGKIVYTFVHDMNRSEINLSEFEFFKNAKVKSYISDILRSPISNSEAIFASRPVRNADGNVVAVMIFESSPEHLYEIMAERTGLGETGEAYLANKQGLIISKTKNAQSMILSKQASSDGVREALGGKSVVDKFNDREGGTVLGAYIWYPKQEWIIASETRMTETDLFGWRLIYENVLLILLLAFVIYFFSRFYAKKFASPIQQLTTSAEIIASGDLTQRVDAPSEDEIGRLGASFNTMVDSLGSMNKQLHEMSIHIGAAANQILATSEEQEHITMQQSSAVSETSATIEELSVSSKQVSQSAQSITQQVEGTARKIMFLSEKAQEINKITTVIVDIAQQIHLLSLNASIEAARAGEHGKGFEVVASEIRKLSEKANKQTAEISVIVQDIQDATSGAVLSTEQAVNGVRSITLSIQQQDTATNQISVAMNEINLGMRQSIEGTKQTVRAVESLNRITSTMSELIKKFIF